jgi:hypothetical protein
MRRVESLDDESPFAEVDGLSDAIFAEVVPFPSSGRSDGSKGDLAGGLSRRAHGGLTHYANVPGAALLQGEEHHVDEGDTLMAVRRLVAHQQQAQMVEQAEEEIRKFEAARQAALDEDRAAARAPRDRTAGAGASPRAVAHGGSVERPRHEACPVTAPQALSSGGSVTTRARDGTGAGASGRVRALALAMVAGAIVLLGYAAPSAMELLGTASLTLVVALAIVAFLRGAELMVRDMIAFLERAQHRRADPIGWIHRIFVWLVRSLMGRTLRARVAACVAGKRKVTLEQVLSDLGYRRAEMTPERVERVARALAALGFCTARIKAERARSGRESKPRLSLRGAARFIGVARTAM